jgi:hypothetical protein
VIKARDRKAGNKFVAMKKVSMADENERVSTSLQ